MNCNLDSYGVIGYPFRVGISVSADIAHISKTDISVSVITPADIYRPICNIGNPFLIGRYQSKSCIISDFAWILIKARISADTIGRYIGYDKSISPYRLSVKFHRYANPDMDV